MLFLISESFHISSFSSQDARTDFCIEFFPQRYINRSVSSFLVLSFQSQCDGRSFMRASYNSAPLSLCLSFTSISSFGSSSFLHSCALMVFRSWSKSPLVTRGSE